MLSREAVVLREVVVMSNYIDEDSTFIKYRYTLRWSFKESLPCRHRKATAPHHFIYPIFHYASHYPSSHELARHTRQPALLLRLALEVQLHSRLTRLLDNALLRGTLLNLALFLLIVE